MSQRAIANVALLALACGLLALVGVVVVGVALYNQNRILTREGIGALNRNTEALKKMVPKEFKDARRD